jgi:pimeloyl-ACP methyl ester carboxylesterase
LRSAPAGLARALRGLGTGALPPLWGKLGELTTPTTLLVGERDQKFREIAATMAAEIAQAQVEIVPRSGHAAHLEQPEQVAAAIMARDTRTRDRRPVPDRTGH